MLCKDCRHWKLGTEYEKKLYGEFTGTCKNNRIIYRKNDRDKTPIDGIMYFDFARYKAFLFTGPEFSCVRFEAFEKE